MRRASTFFGGGSGLPTAKMSINITVSGARTSGAGLVREFPCIDGWQEASVSRWERMSLPTDPSHAGAVGLA